MLSKNDKSIIIKRTLHFGKKCKKSQKMRINLENNSLNPDLYICISSSRILPICEDIFNQQKQQYENVNTTDDNGSL